MNDINQIVKIRANKMVYSNHLNLLGFKAKDKITGCNGVVTSICFDLYGCIQACLTPKNGDCKWFDVSRLEKTSKKRVMEIPDFNEGYIAEGKKGPCESRPV